MKNKGTIVISTVRTPSSNDRFPTAFANEIKGGVHSVDTLSDRDKIPEERRSVGMLCYVAEDGEYYKLGQDNEWSWFDTSASEAGARWGHINGTMSDQTDLNSALSGKVNNSTFTSHTGDSNIHFTQEQISITESQISDLGNYVESSAFTNHTGNSDIHFTQDQISITESQISDFGNYVENSAFTSHTGDSDVHFTQDQISITKSQVSDFGSYVESSSDIAVAVQHSLTSHNIGSVEDGVVSVNLSNGGRQVVSVSGDVEFSFTGFSGARRSVVLVVNVELANSIDWGVDEWRTDEPALAESAEVDVLVENWGDKTVARVTGQV